MAFSKGFERGRGKVKTTPGITPVDNGDGTWTFTVSPEGSAYRWQINGADVAGATGNPQTLTVSKGQTVTVLVTPLAQAVEKTVPSDEPEPEPEVVPVSIMVPGAFDPAKSVEGQDVTLIPPEVEGTPPVTVELVSVEIDEEPVPVQNDSGTLRILGASVSVGALVAVWRATGPGDGNTLTDTVTATVVAAPFEYDDAPGVVNTGTGSIAFGAASGTNPPGIAHAVYVTVPAGGFENVTQVWRQTIDEISYAEVTFSDDGTWTHAIYWRGNMGNPQPASYQYFASAPLVAGDTACLLMIAMAGGTFRTFVSRNGGDFAQFADAAVPAGVTMPLYGQPQVFYDGKAVITEGQFLWGLDSLPPELADLASLNAAKASFVQPDGSRASLNALYGVLGEAAFALYGDAAEDYASGANRGTAGGVGTVTGTFGEIVAPVASEPEVVRSSSGYVAGGGGGDAAPTDAMAILSFVSMPNDPITPNSTRMFTATLGSSEMYIYLTGSGGGQIQIMRRLADGTTATTKSNVSGGTVTPGDNVAFLVQAADGGWSAHISINGGDPVKITEATFSPADATFEVGAASWRVGEHTGSGDKIKVQDISGFFAFALDVLPSLTPEEIFGRILSPAGRRGDLSEITAVFGAQPRVAWYGPAADKMIDKGTGTDFTSTGGTFEDLVIEEPSVGLIATMHSPTALLAEASDSDATLTDPNGSYYSAPSDSQVLALGDTDADLDARLALTVDRSSVVAGEVVYLRIEGLTDEEAALWGLLWEFDTSGEFRYLSDLPPHMRQKNRAAGHHQCAAWDTPGTKTVKVQIIPPVWTGIKGTVLTVEVENRDPDVVFADRTWVVAPDNDFTGAPAGTQVTTFQAAYDAIYNANSGGRIRLKPGVEIAFDGTGHSRFWPHDTTMDGIYIDSWSAGELAKLKPTAAMRLESRCLPEMFFVMKDIDIYQEYDPVTGDGFKTNIFRSYIQMHLTLNGCRLRNMYRGMEGVSATGAYESVGMFGLYDCDITAWCRYGLFLDRCDRFLIRGTAVHQDPNAVIGYEGILAESIHVSDQPNAGPIRWSSAANGRGVFSQLHLFVNHGTSGVTWVDGIAPPGRAHQPVLRLGATTSEGMDALVSEIWAEGGGFSLGGGSNNCVVGSGFLNVSGVYLVKGPNTSSWNFGHSGTWVHDNIIIVPASKKEVKTGSTYSFLGEIGSGSVSATWHTKGIYVFSNTVAFMAEESHLPHLPTYDSIMSMKFSTTHANMPDLVIRDSVLWAPNITLSGETAPRVPDGIRSAGLFGKTPQYKGRYIEMTNGGAIELHTQFATPANANILPVISEASTLRGSVTGVVAALDGLSRLRAEKDQGAVSFLVLR